MNNELHMLSYYPIMTRTRTNLQHSFHVLAKADTHELKNKTSIPNSSKILKFNNALHIEQARSTY